MQDRLDHELEIIARMGFEPIFLIVEDVLNFARQKGVPFSSRGSAASSLVAHCLVIISPDLRWLIFSLRWNKQEDFVHCHGCYQEEFFYRQFHSMRNKTKIGSSSARLAHDGSFAYHFALVNDLLAADLTCNTLPCLTDDLLPGIVNSTHCQLNNNSSGIC